MPQGGPGPGFVPSQPCQNATDPYGSHGGQGGGGGDFFSGAYWVLILLFVLTLATVCYYRHLVRVANEAEREKAQKPKREAAAAVQEVAVPLDDMDFSARTHDLYANAECAVCLAGFTADDGPVVLPCACPRGIPTRPRHRAELGPSDVISAQAPTPSTTPASRRGGRRVWKETRR